jgi:hypothetical protein
MATGALDTIDALHWYLPMTTEDGNSHRQMFGRETLSDLTARSNAIEMKGGLQVLYDVYSRNNVAL